MPMVDVVTPMRSFAISIDILNDKTQIKIREEDKNKKQNYWYFIDIRLRNDTEVKDIEEDVLRYKSQHAVVRI